jgi:hypothetical protein
MTRNVSVTLATYLVLNVTNNPNSLQDVLWEEFSIRLFYEIASRVKLHVMGLLGQTHSQAGFSFVFVSSAH